MMTPLIISGHDIMLTVCQALNISPADIMETRARRRIVARHMVWWLCRELTEMSYPEIGRYFGRDHTTIMHGVRLFSQRITEDPVLNKQALTVKAYLLERERNDHR